MNVFVDYVGHADLYYSMHALFEKRLGWNLYRPMGGAEWKEQNIWTAPLPGYAKDLGVNKEGIVQIEIPIYPYTQHVITYEQFLEMDIDFIITTSWENESSFCNLAKVDKPKALMVRHIANIHERPVICRNILLSTLEPMADDVNWLTFHPEHVDAFIPNPTSDGKLIKSFSNYLPDYASDLAFWNQYAAALPEFEFRMHGLLGYDQVVSQKDVPVAMSNAMFIWHTKGTGGCGYVLRQALASGKPCIVYKDYARIHNTLARNLLKDGINCIDIDPNVHSFNDSVAKIREWSQPSAYTQVSELVTRTFRIDVNFEKEAVAIKQWLLALK